MNGFDCWIFGDNFSNDGQREMGRVEVGLNFLNYSEKVRKVGTLFPGVKLETHSCNETLYLS